MTATVLSLTDRLPPEAAVHRGQFLYNAAYTYLLVEMALNIEAPSPSELIDQLVHSTDPDERTRLADQIARSAP